MKRSTKTYLSSILIATISIFFLSSCSSDELTRERAKDIISEQSGYPYVEFAKLRIRDRNYQVEKGDNTLYVPERSKKDHWVDVSNLVEKGLLTVEKSQCKALHIRQYHEKLYPCLKFTLTKSGKEYANPSVPLKHRRTDRNSRSNIWEGEYAIGIREIEITRLKFENEEKTKVKIEYSSKRVNTTGFIVIPSYLPEEIINHSAILEKYDDGWRVVSVTDKRISGQHPKNFVDVPEFSHYGQ